MILIDYIIKKLRLLWWFLCILWNIIILLLVLIPFFVYICCINCGLIRLALDYRLCIVYTFPGYSNNMIFIYSSFLQHCDSWLYSIDVFLVLTDLYSIPLFISNLYFSNKHSNKKHSISKLASYPCCFFGILKD